MNPERSERIEIPVLPLRDVVDFIRTWSYPYCRGGEKSIVVWKRLWTMIKNHAGRPERKHQPE